MFTLDCDDIWRYSNEPVEILNRIENPDDVYAQPYAVRITRTGARFTAFADELFIEPSKQGQG